MNKEIREIIESYCEGITWLEFAESDLDEMVEKIVNVKAELNNLLKPDVIGSVCDCGANGCLITVCSRCCRNYTGAA